MAAPTYTHRCLETGAGALYGEGVEHHALMMERGVRGGALVRISCRRNPFGMAEAQTYVCTVLDEPLRGMAVALC